jgi:RNA polymerase sigma-70 factor, ECF subfamily
VIAIPEEERGDVPSFAEVFEQYAPYILRVMRHWGVAPADLNDQCQEVFVAVFHGLQRYEGRSSLRTWIYGIAVRVASNYRRRAYVRRERVVAAVPEQTMASGPHEATEENRQRAELKQLLDTLDADKREVFVLYELEELSMKEVAELCGCPLQTAYSRLRAARQLLLEQYRAREQSP